MLNLCHTVYSSSEFDSEQSLLSIMLTKYKTKFTQTDDMVRRATFIPTVIEVPEQLTAALAAPSAPHTSDEVGEMFTINEEFGFVSVKYFFVEFCEI